MKISFPFNVTVNILLPILMLCALGVLIPSSSNVTLNGSPLVLFIVVPLYILLTYGLAKGNIIAILVQLIYVGITIVMAIGSLFSSSLNLMIIIAPIMLFELVYKLKSDLK